MLRTYDGRSDLILAHSIAGGVVVHIQGRGRKSENENLNPHSDRTGNRNLTLKSNDVGDIPGYVPSFVQRRGLFYFVADIFWRS